MPAINRCAWADLNKPDYIRSHDQELGAPVRDDRTRFEFLLLESAQAGLVNDHSVDCFRYAELL